MKMYSEVFEDATTCFTAEVAAREGDDLYPAMVTIDVESGSLLPDDARAFGLMLVAAAESAEQWNETAFGRREVKP
jgi:gluconate kinase